MIFMFVHCGCLFVVRFNKKNPFELYSDILRSNRLSVLKKIGVFHFSMTESWNSVVYFQVLAVLMDWLNDAPDQDPRGEWLESARECCRSVLTACGHHRLTGPFAEAWQVFTTMKVILNNSKPPDRPPPVASAAPSTTSSGFSALGLLHHASILEEEMAASLDLFDEIINYVELRQEPDVLTWLTDLRFSMSTAFSLLCIDTIRLRKIREWETVATSCKKKKHFKQESIINI